MRYALPLLLALAAPLAAQTPFAAFHSASDPVLADPHDLAIGPDGRLYVADKFSGNVVVFDPETLTELERFGNGQLSQLRDISFGPDGRAYVAVSGASAIAIFDLSGPTPELANVLSGIPGTEGALAHSNGRIYAMASATGHLLAIENGEVVAVVEGMRGAHDVAEAPDGTIWVADNFQSRLRQFDPDLTHIRDLDAPQFGFQGPRYLDIDPFGRLVVADQDAHRVLLIDPTTETLLGVIGDGTPGLGPNLFDDPEGALVHGESYYFSDSDNNRIVRYVVAIN